MDRSGVFYPLFETENGVVFRCVSCPYYHVAFGPVILANDPHGLRTLSRLLDRLEPQEDPRFHLGDRCFHLHTPSGDVGLVFSPDEIEELRDLVRGAVAMLELDDLIADTLGSDATDSSRHC
ncbi:MAG: hypothetical protein AAF624_19035 [Bacteroidota bacterium]